ncbi:hypothetical protein [Paraburkholderia rhizosphaerae]|uniref:Uncharacterized protein n=1 Tax=Paraburkholderia rhizosphaerae TaxID=480658 RepID=A0A4R8KNP0_9BURK|nr:hypothetical protein [Paraburkholderia rhizosphaerae]TDY31211.1 hypothetical protein BX592_1623 [Paraburkholderia rhizosphaerae]
METDTPKAPEWKYRGKTIRQLIKELQTFENQDVKVQISIDDGENRKPISLVAHADGGCLLMYCGE